MCIRDRTGVNDSSKETKFVSGAYKLTEGQHLQDQDKNKVLMHKDLAEKNGLKVGDKIKVKSNLFDADNAVSYTHLDVYKRQGSGGV